MRVGVRSRVMTLFRVKVGVRVGELCLIFVVLESLSQTRSVARELELESVRRVERYNASLACYVVRCWCSVRGAGGMNMALQPLMRQLVVQIRAGAGDGDDSDLVPGECTPS